MPFKDPERRREYGRAWIRNNAEKAREAMRRWRRNHPDKHAAQSRQRYARDPKRVQRITDSSPNRAAVRRAVDHRRRERVRGTPSFSAAEWIALVALHEGRCAYCGESRPLQIDHRLPIARGGLNTINNILPACGPCNQRKATLTEEEFRARLAQERGEDLQS